MSDEKISQLDPVTDVQDSDDYVLARSGASNRITGASLKAAVGGSQPGVGDWITVDINTGPSVPNDGTNTTITWDGTVYSGGAGSVGLSVDKTKLALTHSGIYTVSAYAQFGTSDQTGLRAVAISQMNVAKFCAGATQSFSGGPIETSVALATISWTGAWEIGDGDLFITALVEGAVGAIPVDYAYLTAVMVAALGT